MLFPVCDYCDDRSTVEVIMPTSLRTIAFCPYHNRLHLPRIIVKFRNAIIMEMETV